MSSSENVSRDSSDAVHKAIELQTKTNRLQTAKKVVGLVFALAIILGIGSAIAAYILHGGSSALAFKATLYGAAALGGSALILAITLVALAIFKHKTQNQLDKVDFYDLLDQYPDSRETVLKAMKPHQMQELFQNPSLKENDGLLTTLAEKRPDLVVANLMFIETEVLASLLDKNQAGIEQEALSKLNAINPKKQSWAIGIYGAFTTSFGKPHERVLTHGVETGGFGDPVTWKKWFIPHSQETLKPLFIKLEKINSGSLTDAIRSSKGRINELYQIGYLAHIFPIFEEK